MCEGYGNAVHALRAQRSHTRRDGYFMQQSEPPSMKGLVSSCVPREGGGWKPGQNGQVVSMET